MKRIIYIIAASVATLLTVMADAQNVGIGTTSPDPNAALEISSTNKGMLYPRVALTSTSSPSPLGSHVAGMVVYNTATVNDVSLGIYVNDGTRWAPVAVGLYNNSSQGTAVVSGYSCSTASAGTLYIGSPVSGVTQTITATVTTVGTYNISAAANGVTFNGTGTFTATGAQNVVLTATGTPAALGATSFALNTTPGCSFNRTVLAYAIPGTITLGSNPNYFIASVFDQDYLPYTAPAATASFTGPTAADGVNEAIVLNIQGTLTTTGVTITIPCTATGAGTLAAYAQTVNVPAAYTQDGLARNVTLSWPTTAYTAATTTITATLATAGGTLNVKQLDLQTGVGNNALGFLLAGFTYPYNSGGGTYPFGLRAIAGIPDRNISDAGHVMLYLPIISPSGRTWLNNSLGTDYSNTKSGVFNPAQQATSLLDYHAFGSLYQWGRYSDGHELVNYTSATAVTAINGTTNTVSTTDVPGNNLFINSITNNPDYQDWRSPQNNNLWQGVNGANNPCPIGFRLPTSSEVGTEMKSNAICDNISGYSSVHKLVGQFQRTVNNTFYNPGSGGGYFWTSDGPAAFTNANSGGTYNYYVSYFAGTYFAGQIFANFTTRGNGFTVRCIKD